jgi:hypothetical protein
LSLGFEDPDDREGNAPEADNLSDRIVILEQILLDLRPGTTTFSAPRSCSSLKNEPCSISHLPDLGVLVADALDLGPPVLFM